MKKLTAVIDNINEELNKYLFKELNKKEEKTFEKLLNAREFIQNIIKENIEIKNYTHKRYESKDKAFKAKCFLKRYANIETELITYQPYTHGMKAYYTLEVLE